jgi:phytoene dehydrogenase-like protein
MNGYEVHLHEAAEKIGGGARTEELTLPGFHHDVCSAVHPMGVTSPFFRSLPLQEHGLEWIHSPILMAHPFDDGTAAVLRRSTIDTGESLERSDAKAYRKLIDPFVENWEGLFEDALSPVLRIPRHPLIMARMGAFGLQSAAGLSRRVFESDRARAFFLGIAAHVLLPMEASPSGAFGIMLAVAGHAAGWPIPRGGSQSISNALASLLRSQGGVIHTSSPVSSLEPFQDYGAVVLDLTPRQALKIAGEKLPKSYRAKLGSYRYAPGVFKIDWALSGPIPWTARDCREAGVIHLGGDSAEIIHSAAAAWNGSEDPRPYVILTQPSLFDPSRCPPGKHTAWAYCHVPSGSTEDRTEAIESQIERFAPGFRDLILKRSTMNTRQLEAHNPNLVGGDINGGVQDLRQLVFRPVRRTDPYSTPLQGLFLCSASTPPGGAVHGMCGYHAAQSVLRHLGKQR